MNRQELEQKSLKDLQAMAREVSLAGRSKMNKAELVNALAVPEPMVVETPESQAFDEAFSDQYTLSPEYSQDAAAATINEMEEANRKWVNDSEDKDILLDLDEMEQLYGSVVPKKPSLAVQAMRAKAKKAKRQRKQAKASRKRNRAA